MEDHKQRLDKEYETLMQNFAKDLEKLRLRHAQELDKKVRKKVGIMCYKTCFENSSNCMSLNNEEIHI